MKKLDLYSTAKLLTVTLLLTVVFTACSNSVSDDHDEHEPVGLVVFSDNALVLTQSPDGTIDGNFSIIAGTTVDFTVQFLDAEEDPFTPDVEEHSTTFSVINGSDNISITTSELDPYRFDISGVAAGSSTFTITLLHEDAAEFVSLELPVTVTAAQ